MDGERQLTKGPGNKDLDNNINFSPDGRWLVFDFRDTGGINTNTRLGVVNVNSGEIRVFYEQQPPSKGVGAASFLNDKEVVAIHALTNGITYDMTVRGGMIITLDGSARPRWLDSRNIVPPFTPGALRGGTHKHEPDATGEWIGFTYNDSHMKTVRGSDLRNVGVSRRGRSVRVPADKDGANFVGESFTVLLTSCVDRPRPGSDEYRRADGDCWVGAQGYPTSAGKPQRARAFRGAVGVADAAPTAAVSDVFLVDVPDKLDAPSDAGPLEGTETSYPHPPRGATVRRLTRTADRTDAELRGITGHLRTAADGRWIAFIGKVRRGAVVEQQVFVVSPTSGEVRQLSRLPGGVAGDPRYSPDGRFVAVSTFDGAVCTVSAGRSTWGHTTLLSRPSAALPGNIAVSPDSKLLAYNRTVEGVQQVFVVEAG